MQLSHRVMPIHCNETVVYAFLSTKRLPNKTMFVPVCQACTVPRSVILDVVVTSTHTWACIITYSVYHSIRNIRWFIVGRVCSLCCRLRLVRNIHSSRIVVQIEYFSRIRDIFVRSYVFSTSDRNSYNKCSPE